MPITQDRMIAVLRAAKALEDALEFIASVAYEELMRVKNGGTTIEQAVNVIDITARSLKPGEAIMQPLRKEWMNIEIRGKYNNKQKLRQQRRRERSLRERGNPIKMNAHNPGQQSGYSLLQGDGELREKYNRWNDGNIAAEQVERTVQEVLMDPGNILAAERARQEEAMETNHKVEFAAPGAPPPVAASEFNESPAPPRENQRIHTDRKTGETFELTSKFAEPNATNPDGSPLSGVNPDDLAGDIF